MVPVKQKKELRLLLTSIQEILPEKSETITSLLLTVSSLGRNNKNCVVITREEVNEIIEILNKSKDEVKGVQIIKNEEHAMNLKNEIYKFFGINSPTEDV